MFIDLLKKISLKSTCNTYIKNSSKLSLNNINKTIFKQKFVYTGKFKGRYPQGRRFVIGQHNINFDNDFIPLEKEIKLDIETEITNNIIPNIKKVYYSQKSVGLPNNLYGLNINLYSTHLYSKIFAKNMFHKYCNEIDNEINIFHFPYNKLKLPNLPNEMVIIDPEKKDVIICGTGYAGEIKKSVFTLMNYHCMENNILPMHCSAHYDNETKESSIFFGLSGTGKTTHSLCRDRVIIGDDEHGWSKDGIFNFENGFYAKTDGITDKNEPLIYENIYGNALCENVKVIDNKFNFTDTSLTKNGRVSIPLKNLKSENNYGRRMAPHPKNIFFLSCDVLGVLPHVVKLNKNQALDYYTLGYTSKTPGTEQNIDEPKITFSPFFGKIFMPHELTLYRKKMDEYLDEFKPEVYMINTGWIKGDYKTSKRIELEKTRKTIKKIQAGEVYWDSIYNKSSNYVYENIFNFKIPYFEHLDKLENYPHLNPNWELRAKKLQNEFRKRLIKTLSSFQS